MGEVSEMENCYLDKDYEQLMNDSSIDPENPDVLYACAQCLKTGRGVAKDEAQYLELLREAAEAGSAQAQAELQEQIGQEKQKTQESGRQETIENASIYELEKMVKEKRADACYRLYQISLLELGNKEEAQTYLEKAISYVKPGRDSAEFQRTLWKAKGDFLLEEGNEEDALAAYKMAVELNDVQACKQVCELYQSREHTEEEASSLEYYRNKLLQYGTEDDRYEIADAYLKESQNLKAVKVLLKITEQPDCSDELYARCRHQLECLSPARYPADTDQNKKDGGSC